VGQTGHCKSSGLYIIFYRKGNNSSFGNRIFCTPQNTAVKSVLFFSDRICIVQRAR
jgi:hypothetical protein